MGTYFIIFYYIGIHILGSKETPYSFTKDEMDRFNPDAWWPSVWLAYYRENW